MTNAHALFDVNCQLGPYPWGEIAATTPADLLARMDEVGIARALVGSTVSWRHDPATGNRQIVAAVAGQPRLRPCWVALPDSCGEIASPTAFAADAIAAGVGAVRVYPRDHGFDLDGRDFAGYPEALAASGLPVLVDLAQTTWAALETLACAHPELAIIVCQLGYRVLRRVAALLGRVANVYVDLSDLSSHEGLEWLCANFGPTRLVFGTGAPLRDPAEAVTRLLWSDLDDESVDRIGRRTLEALVPQVAR